MPPMAQKDLRAVARAAKAVDKARSRLRDAVYAATKSGESLRDIAHHAEISTGTVRSLLEEARRLERESQSK